MTFNEIQNFLEEQSEKKTDGIFIFAINEETQSFEETYLSIRKKENRILDITTVKRLPHVEINHQYKVEWDIRANNAKHLRTYLSKTIKSKFQNERVTIVDLGCGNGWLSNYLINLPNVNLISIDINLVELRQAVQLKLNENQYYIYADILKTKILPDSSVEFVILNSSFQYFKNFISLFQQIEPMLKSDFEIHILDTQFYTKEKVNEAKDRSNQYYNKNMESKMVDYYFHHTYEELRNFEVEFLYNPNSIYNRVQSKIKDMSPFPWIKIYGQK